MSDMKLGLCGHLELNVACDGIATCATGPWNIHKLKSMLIWDKELGNFFVSLIYWHRIAKSGWKAKHNTTQQCWVPIFKMFKWRIHDSLIPKHNHKKGRGQLKTQEYTKSKHWARTLKANICTCMMLHKTSWHHDELFPCIRTQAISMPRHKFVSLHKFCKCLRMLKTFWKDFFFNLFKITFFVTFEKT